MPSPASDPGSYGAFMDREPLPPRSPDDDLQQTIVERALALVNSESISPGHWQVRLASLLEAARNLHLY
jgi:hypothetical protein